MAAPDLSTMIRSEKAKCAKDPIHIAKRYAKIQHPVKGKILFNLFPFQETTLLQFFQHRLNVIVKSRQMGISTLVAFFALVKMLFQDDFKVVVICTNQNTAKNLVQKVQIMHENFPSWLRKGVVENNKMGLKFNNGSEIKAISSSGNAARSEACSLLIIDEMAFVDGIQEIWSAAQLTLATGGSAILLSTPNGVGNLFHQIVSRAKEGSSEFDGIEKFNLISLPWDLHPERDQKWRNEQTERLGIRIAAQECDCLFTSSGHTVLLAEINQYYLTDMCKDPLERKGPGSDYWYWDYPKYSIDYMITADPSRGDGEDYSAFEVIDIERNEQVAEFVGMIGTRDFGRFLAAVGHEWNQALLVVDNKNVGWDTIQELLDVNYPNLYYTYKNDPFMDENIHIRKNHDLKLKEDMVPGFTTTTRVRPVMISKIETYYQDKSPLRYSKRLMNQYEVFIWKEGKAQAQYGYNDDLVMCDSMALFMRDTALKMRQKGLELTKKAITNTKVSIYVPQYNLNDPYKLKTSKGTEDLRWLIQ